MKVPASGMTGNPNLRDSADTKRENIESSKATNNLENYKPNVPVES
jgi:hypothetical protein